MSDSKSRRYDVTVTVARDGATLPDPAAFAVAAEADGTDFGLGLEARSRALVSQGQAAEGWYREAIERLGRAGHRSGEPFFVEVSRLMIEWLSYVPSPHLPDLRHRKVAHPSRNPGWRVAVFSPRSSLVSKGALQASLGDRLRRPLTWRPLTSIPPPARPAGAYSK
jgi:hypothetical protein